MLESSCLELINVFCEQVKGVYGPEKFKQLVDPFLERF
jgi:hypothetical protein